jgi:hypothetical protein
MAARGRAPARQAIGGRRSVGGKVGLGLVICGRVA